MSYSDRQLYEAFNRGDTYHQIATERGLSVDSVRGRVSRYKRKQISRNGATTPFKVNAPRTIRRYSNIPVIDTNVLVCGDVHVPTTDWHMLDLFIAFGKKHMRKGERVALIAGDLFNMDAVSSHALIAAPYSVADEIEYAAAILQRMFEVFDIVVLSMGNHDLWLNKATEGGFDVVKLARLLDRDGKLWVTSSSKVWIKQHGIVWRATHQRNYSKIRGRVASDLAKKYECNMITHHEHHVSVSRDESNRYTAIANGMLADEEKLHYVNVFDSTSPHMCNGFTFVRDGAAHLLTPYETFTDWNMWGMGATALAAIEAARLRHERLTQPQDANVITMSPNGDVGRIAA